MRVLILGLLLSSIAQPCLAQTFLPAEPMMMAPNSVVFVDNGSCSSGKVLKVQGGPIGQRRKKSCVPITDIRPHAVKSR